MKKLFLFVFVLGFTPSVFAASFGDFLSYLTGYGEDFWNLLTVETPSMFDRFFAWVLEILVVWKYQALIASAKMAWSVAGVILTDLQFGSQLNNLIGFLPNDVQAALVQLRLLDAIELIIQAFIARFALDIIN